MTATLPVGVEKRKLTSKSKGDYEFNFLVIDAPEKWPEADSIHGQYKMPILGKDKSILFDLTGISLGQWEQLEEANRIPEWTKEGQTPTDEFTLQREEAIAAKRVAVIELSTGKKIPGEKPEDKIKYLQSLNPGEVQVLYLYIANNVCGFDQSGLLLGQYQQAVLECAQAEVMQFTDFESWKQVTDTGYVFRMQRPTDNFIMEFPLRNISSKDKTDIELETRQPEAPLVPARDKETRKWIPNEREPDLNDPSYQARLRVVNQKRVVMFLNACLPFELPGNNIRDQYDWIAKRLVGDIIRLRNFIEEDLCGYRSRYDFFSVV